MSDREAQIIAALRRGYGAFNRQDFDAAMEIAHPDLELFPPARGAPYRGADAVRAWMEPDAFSSQEIELLEIEVGGNRALVLQRTKARGAGSGIEMEIESWALWTFDEELRATRIQGFMPYEQEKARAAFQSPE